MSLREKINFDQIDKEKFRERIHSNFSGAYLTLISIIQGVAFGILVTEVKPIIQSGDINNMLLVFPAMSLFGIILVFYFYSWFVSVIYTPPSLMESSVPIVLAVTETLPMLFFQEPKSWWFYTAIFCLGGIIGFANTLLHLYKENYKDTDHDNFSDIHKELRNELLANIGFCAVLAVIAFISWFTYPIGCDQKKGLSTHDIVFVAFFFPIMIAFGVTSSHFFLRNILRLGGFLPQEE